MIRDLVSYRITYFDLFFFFSYIRVNLYVITGVDVDECTNVELNDCHSAGKCTNVFGSFHCTCPEGYRDPWAGDNHRSGRNCETCNAAYCNHRGECSFHNGQPICKYVKLFLCLVPSLPSTYYLPIYLLFLV